MDDLFEELAKTKNSAIYPYHMPGHKRQACGRLSEELCGMDITEIDGFDNLHHSEGILLRLQQRAADIYGADESFYLVNGSTAGILSAVSAVLPQGGRLLMARNCHKSVYHAVYLRNLKNSYLEPPFLSEYDLFGAVEPEQVHAALESEPDIGAVLLVSPTYEGRISNIRAIAEIVHEKGIPLIVDEAHGAHLGLGGFAPENSCRLGADIVIHSAHKTLPALTQAALLHVNGKLVDRGKLRRFLRIYQTSSPSYLLMASIDNALHFVQQDGGKAFESFAESYHSMLRELGACRFLKILPWIPGKQDIGKLVVSVKGTELSGRELYDILRQKYALQLEMAAQSYVLAMFTVSDTQEGYRRMSQALLEIDGNLSGADLPSGKRQNSDGEKKNKYSLDEKDFLRGGHSGIPLSAAWDMETRPVMLSESAGRLAGEFVSLYPPGVPFLVPGEYISGELCAKMRQWIDSGLTVEGLEIRGTQIWVNVLNESRE